jgi:cobalt-zinc-cadmium efflux system protein
LIDDAPAERFSTLHGLKAGEPWLHETIRQLLAFQISMGHHHHHHPHAGTGRAFAIGVVLNVGFVAVEATAGFWTGSLSLLADAGHNLSDVLGLGLACAAAWLGTRPPSARFTYGLRRSTIISALLNAVFLLLAVGAIAWESIRRFWAPATASGYAMIAVAAVGVVINGLTALLFLRGQKEDLNVRGAYLHMLADAGVSLGVVVAGLVINSTGWLWIDPAVSLVIAVVITVGTWNLLTQSLHLIFDAVPHEIDPAEIRAYLAALPGVTEIHDLHIWALSTTETALTAHLVRPNSALDDDWLAAVTQALHDRFGIEHATLQLESGQGARACRLAPEDVL